MVARSIKDCLVQDRQGFGISLLILQTVSLLAQYIRIHWVNGEGHFPIDESAIELFQAPVTPRSFIEVT